MQKSCKYIGPIPVLILLYLYISLRFSVLWILFLLQILAWCLCICHNTFLFDIVYIQIREHHINLQKTYRVSCYLQECTKVCQWAGIPNKHISLLLYVCGNLSEYWRYWEVRGFGSVFLDYSSKDWNDDIVLMLEWCLH